MYHQSVKQFEIRVQNVCERYVYQQTTLADKEIIGALALLV